MPDDPVGLERGFAGSGSPIASRAHGEGTSLAGRQPSAGELDTTFAPVIDSKPGLIYAVKSQPDGKLLVGGGFKSFNGFTSSGIVRLNSDRSVDTDFSATIRGTVFAIGLQADGKIVIAGTFYSVNGAARSSIARLNTDGSLDTGFNPGAGADNTVRDVAIQPDGKIVVVGQFVFLGGAYSPCIGRLNSNGTRDETYQSALRAADPSSLAQTFSSSVALQPDGKIVVAGAMLFQGDSPSELRKFILRFNADGGVDTGFTRPAMNSNPWRVKLQPDGKILMAGFFTTVAGMSRVRVARLNSDGNLDTGFDPGGGANSSVLFLDVESSGHVLIGGVFSAVNGMARGGAARLNSNGTLDASFSPAGPTFGAVYGITPAAGGYYINGTFTSFSGSNQGALVATNANGSVDGSFVVNTILIGTVRSIAVQPNGKILIGGIYNQLNGLPSLNISRLNSNGTRDTSFDANGISGFNISRFVFQPDGKILVIGIDMRVNNGPLTQMIRLNADGTHDTSFTLAAIPQISFGYTAAVQSDGKILFSFATSNSINNAGVVRLNSDGSIDPTFSSFPYAVEAIAIQPDGKILLAGPFAFGFVGPGGTTWYAGIVRVNPDGSSDPTFRSALTAYTPGFTEVRSMHLQADGKIILGGRLYVGESQTLPVGVLRLNASGSVDGSFHSNTISSPFNSQSVTSLHVGAQGNITAVGLFDNYGGVPRNNIVRLGLNGVIDTTFNAGTDSPVNVVTGGADGSILIGGSFETVNGTPRTAIARLLPDSPQSSAPFDFDGDGKTDIGIFRPVGAFSEWWINRSGNGQTFALQFGASTDKIAPADFTGDGKADIAFFRPASGEWYVLRSEDFSFFALPFGANGDIPVPADYDADGKADFAVFRSSNSTWYISQSSGAPTRIEQFGAIGDQPVVSDYDGDGKADIGIFRAAATGAEWWINRSTAGVLAIQFGASTDKPVQGDYTGDGKTDIAIWKPGSGEWFIVRSEDFSFYGFPFGANEDVIAPGDYDGDGKFDPTVFRPASATWFIARTTAGTQIVQFGANGDRPVPNAFVP